MHASRALVVSLAAALAWPLPARAEPAYLLSGTNLVVVSTEAPQRVRATVPITGISAGEVLVGIDVRPQNGLLYGLGVDATANTATLYAISRRTGVAGVVGTPGSIAFVDASGVNPIDFPDPAVVGWGVDLNPAADRLRVVGGSVNFRVDPNTGAPIDGNFGGAVATGVNPDGPVNGSTTTLDAAAYTNNQPNNGNITTLYTLDASTNALLIQNPPNAGTQTLAQSVTLGGNTLDFTGSDGFDIPAGVNAAASGMGVVSGSGFAALTVGGVGGLYRLNLVNAQATLIGNLGNGSLAIGGFALQPVQYGVAIVALSQAGTSLVRFSSSTPGTSTTVTITGVDPAEILAALDFRPQTGQLYALGVNDGANTATLYRLDPQTGAAIAVGAVGQIAFVDGGGVPVDFPSPASTGFGFAFNPTVDRIRVTAASGLNFRVNPNTGAALDADMVAAGVNPDGPIQGSGSAGVTAAAYTNAFGQNLTGGVTTLYTLDPAQNMLFIQNPPNAGVQTQGRVLTLGGAPLDFTGAAGLDIVPSVRVQTSNAPARGEAYAALTVGGVPRLYAIALQSAEATLLGNAATALRSIAIADPELDILRDGFE